eukprot:33344-Lingulodinium_polyedra.AAC.1
MSCSTPLPRVDFGSRVTSTTQVTRDHRWRLQRTSFYELPVTVAMLRELGEYLRPCWMSAQCSRWRRQVS